MFPQPNLFETTDSKSGEKMSPYFQKREFKRIISYLSFDFDKNVVFDCV